jgi:hypothetical protein
VRLSRIQYAAGASDLLSGLRLQADQLGTQIAVITLRDAQLANQIGLHLILGDSFESKTALSVAGQQPTNLVTDL